MSKAKRLGRALLWIILAATVCGVAVFGYKLWESQAEYTEANNYYDAIADSVKQERQTTGLEDEMAQVEIPDIRIDFKKLKETNEDCIAWLYSPDTVVDYPVVKAADYNYYLYRLLDKSYNRNGTLFLDYNCKPDFTDKMSIIYGHNMKSGRMFGSLPGYKKQAYYDQHPYMYLYTVDGNYRVELLYGCVIGAGKWQENGFMFQENYETLLEYAAANSTFVSTTTPEDRSNYIALSTCSYEFNDARYVVIGKLVPEYPRQ